MTKLITVMLAVMLSASTCLASGWNDFELDIGDGYTVVRANSMDVCIGKANGSAVLYPLDYDNVGPVTRYITTPQHIFTKNPGRKPRNLFDGDILQEIDSSREFFFIIVKGADEVIGPLSQEEFAKRPEVGNIGKLDWQVPKNPNFWGPLLGTLYFLAMSIYILAPKFVWVTILVIIVLVSLIRPIRRKKKEKAEPEVGQV